MRPFPARAFPDAGSYRCGVLPAARRFAPALTAVNADADLPAPVSYTHLDVYKRQQPFPGVEKNRVSICIAK